jgi:hypothetical protein
MESFDMEKSNGGIEESLIFNSPEKGANDYVFIDVSELARIADSAGISSYEDGVFFEWTIRARSGELPGCVRVIGGDRNGHLMVFDLRSPPGFLPHNMKEECRLAAEIILERRMREWEYVTHSRERTTEAEPVASWSYG